jgi:endogenous inhibitor of DNA gyrase (YacG/DUF329 family)
MPDDVPAPPKKLCVICGRKEAVAPFTPFCSKRCADVDLNRWLSGTYAIPVKDNDPDDQET